MKQLVLEYKDEKTGIVLKGFSQVDLDKLNHKFKLIYIVITIGLIFMMGVIIWLLWQMKKYRIVTYFIQGLK